MWGRLGYPRRALRLHAAAVAIVAEHGGEVPVDHDELLALPGVGAYTAAAISAFAFDGREPVLDTNVRRVGFVARLLARNGVLVLVPVIAPYADARAQVRAAHDADAAAFVEVHVATSVDVCAERDVKGLYAKQRAGEVSGLTGVDDPYEIPQNPELRLETAGRGVDEAADEVYAALRERGLA